MHREATLVALRHVRKKEEGDKPTASSTMNLIRVEINATLTVNPPAKREEMTRHICGE